MHAADDSLSLRRMIRNIPINLDAENDQIYIIRNMSHTFLVGIRLKPIITVDKSYPLTPGNLKSRVSCCCQSLILLSNDANTRISGCKIIKNIDRMVRRSVIHTDNFQITVCLFAYTL